MLLEILDFAGAPWWEVVVSGMYEGLYVRPDWASRSHECTANIPKFPLHTATEIRGVYGQMVSTPSSARESTAGLGVREHATYLWQRKTSETGRDYGHHLTITKEMRVARCFSRMYARMVDTTAMEEDAPGFDRFLTGALGCCSNTQLW